LVRLQKGRVQGWLKAKRCREELLGEGVGGGGKRGYIREGIKVYERQGNEEAREPCGPYLPVNKVHNDNALEHPKCFVSIATMNAIVSGQVVLG